MHFAKKVVPLSGRLECNLDSLVSTGVGAGGAELQRPSCSCKTGTSYTVLACPLSGAVLLHSLSLRSESLLHFRTNDFDLRLNGFLDREGDSEPCLVKGGRSLDSSLADDSV